MINKTFCQIELKPLLVLLKQDNPGEKKRRFSRS